VAFWGGYFVEGRPPGTGWGGVGEKKDAVRKKSEKERSTLPKKKQKQRNRGGDPMGVRGGAIGCVEEKKSPVWKKESWGGTKKKRHRP